MMKTDGTRLVAVAARGPQLSEVARPEYDEEANNRRLATSCQMLALGALWAQGNANMKSAGV